VLIVALSAQLVQANAQVLTPYLESSGTEQKPRSNAGFSMQADRLRMRADFALRGQQIPAPIHALQRRPMGSTEVVPNLRSAFTIAKNLDLETGVSFAEWNADSETTFDTRLRYKKSLRAFFDELDGSLWRSPDGLTKQSFRLGFHENIGTRSEFAPLAISGEALLEATQRDAGALAVRRGDSRRVRVEARVAGLMPAFLGANHTVGFNVERKAGARSESARALTYDQAWTLRSLTKLRLNFRFRRHTQSGTASSEPSLDFTWRSKF
jgi:hypothetical protein